MADFAPALAKTLKNEGGVYHSQKTGEWANFGITIWTLRDLGILPKLPRETPATDAEIAFLRALTPDAVSPIYETNYWKPLKCDQLSQEVAEKLFDLGVNCGVGTAAKFLQNAINRISWPSTPLMLDGVIGPKTIEAANQCSQPDLLESLKLYAGRYYRELAQNNAALAENLPGWLKRLDA